MKWAVDTPELSYTRDSKQRNILYEYLLRFISRGDMLD